MEVMATTSRARTSRLSGTRTSGKTTPSKPTAAPAASKRTAATAGAARPKPKARTAAAKTGPTAIGFDTYLAKLSRSRRADAETLDAIMRTATRQPPVIWGSGIVGYGSLRYVYDSGREGDWPIVAFAVRSAGVTVYLMDGFTERTALLARLGRHKTAKACLYLARVADVDRPALASLVRASVAAMRARYRPSPR
jgi:hypothetical protein